MELFWKKMLYSYLINENFEALKAYICVLEASDRFNIEFEISDIKSSLLYFHIKTATRQVKY